MLLVTLQLIGKNIYDSGNSAPGLVNIAKAGIMFELVIVHLDGTK